MMGGSAPFAESKMNGRVMPDLAHSFFNVPGSGGDAVSCPALGFVGPVWSLLEPLVSSFPPDSDIFGFDIALLNL